MNRKIWTCAFFAAVTLLQGSSAQIIEEEESWTALPESEAKGVVMEFEHNGDEEEQNRTIPKAGKEAKEIEFIIGGQGENGIAKRGVLKVND